MASVRPWYDHTIQSPEHVLGATALSPSSDGNLEHLTVAQISGDRIVSNMRQSGITWA